MSSALVEELFGIDKAVVGMVHVPALPGTPLASLGMGAIVGRCVNEAKLLASAGFDAVMIENMHDRPYLKGQLGPEIVAGMTAVAQAVRQAIDLPLGIQILAGANTEALAVASTTGASFIRAENFVFAHIADEGLMPDAQAGPLLRYRRQISADHVRIFADVKKKHASHAVTSDLPIEEAAIAAEFCGADAVVVTGVATGRAVDPADLRDVASSVQLPVVIGSGLTHDNIGAVWQDADVFIVGSFLKDEGLWHRPLNQDRIDAFLRATDQLRQQRE